ncbi:MAG TPA: N-acyl-D-glucosamine 2-epimerase, partial [Stellaceae bacterium]
MNIDFTFSDTIAGYVSSYRSGENCFTLRTSDDREFAVYLTPNTYARYSYNLTEAYQDATGGMPTLLALPRQFVYAYGSFYPADETGRFEAQWLIFPGHGPGVYRHEEPDWWINQSRSIGRSYMKWQF